MNDLSSWNQEFWFWIKQTRWCSSCNFFAVLSFFSISSFPKNVFLLFAHIPCIRRLTSVTLICFDFGLTIVYTVLCTLLYSFGNCVIVVHLFLSTSTIRLLRGFFLLFCIKATVFSALTTLYLGKTS